MLQLECVIFAAVVFLEFTGLKLAEIAHIATTCIHISDDFSISAKVYCTTSLRFSFFIARDNSDINTFISRIIES